MLKIAWFTSGRDEEAFKLLKEVYTSTKTGKIKGEISLCFINKEMGESVHSDQMIGFLEREGVPFETLSVRRFLAERGLSLQLGRELFDLEVKKRIERFTFDIIFLAGYMLILSKNLYDHFTILNLHPSLPGKYKGKWEDVIRMTILNKDKEFGAMVHIVEEKLDEGPPLTYFRLVVDDENLSRLYDEASLGDEGSFKRLFLYIREREFSLETPLIVETLRLLSEGRLKIIGKRPFFDGAEIPYGLDITGILQKGLQR